MRFTSVHIEYAVARHLNWRRCLIVPNVSWGFGLRYEADMVVVRESGWAHEIEIKVTAADIRADKKKRVQHNGANFKTLWFAVPESLSRNADIPDRAGIYSIDDALLVKTIRAPRTNPGAKKLTPVQIRKLYELAAMRVWSLKEASIWRINQKLIGDETKKKELPSSHGASSGMGG